MTKWILFMGALLCMLALPTVSAETVKVGGQTITYEEMIDYGDMHSYYVGDRLVLSTFDDNNDGKEDQWFVYGDDFTVTDALGDTDLNGKPDYFVSYDELGNAVSERVSGQFLKDLGKALSGVKWHLLCALAAALAVFGIAKLRKRKRGAREHQAERHQKDKHQKKRHHEGKDIPAEKRPTRKLFLLILAIIILLALLLAQQHISSLKKEKEITFTQNLPPLQPPENTAYDPYQTPAGAPMK